MIRKHENFILYMLVLVGTVLFCSFSYTIKDAMAASAPDIKIAAVYPLSGAFSRNGNLTLQGIKASIGWVNDNGGIKSLGGAKLVPVIADCGSTLEGASSTMERVCRDPDVVIAMGSYASSLTMASTEVTERLGIPQFAVSYSNQLNGRGFKWGFYVTAPSVALAEIGLHEVNELAKNTGHVLKTSMIVGDNTVSAREFFDTGKKIFADMGIKIIGEEIWSSGTLVDATPVMRKVKTLNPDIVLLHAHALSEAQMCLMKRKEFKLKQPFVSFGAIVADPSFRPIGAEVLEGYIALTGSYPHKLTPKEWITRSLEQCRKEYSNEPWVGQELGFAWTMVPAIAEILERAGSRDRKAIRDAATKLDIHDVLATRHTPKQGMAFGADGRLAKKYQGCIIVQWQDGLPRPVFPPDLALAKPKWVSE